MTEFDWAALMRIGVSELRLKPEEFWRLTPAELLLMIGPVGAPPMRRDTMAELMAQFPDDVEDSIHG